MARRLLLTKSEIVRADYQWLSAYRLRIVATDPSNSGADPNVFLYLRNRPNPYDGEVRDIFHTVASPPDMAEYPVGEPDDRTTFPFYRLDYIELDLRAASIAEKVYLIIVAEVNRLLQVLDKLESITETEQVWVGDGPPQDGNSDSSSISG